MMTVDGMKKEKKERSDRGKNEREYRGGGREVTRSKEATNEETRF